MKKSILLYSLLLWAFIGFTKEKVIFQLVSQIPSSTFIKKEIFYVNDDRHKVLSNMIKVCSLLDINQTSLAEIANEKPYALEFDLPIDGHLQKVQLIRNNTVDENTVFRTKENGEEKDFKYQSGAYYHGIIKGNSNSIAAFSFFENNIIGVLGTNLGNYVIGKSDIHNFNSQEYIIYNDRDLLIPKTTQCATNDEHMVSPFVLPNEQSFVETITTKCVKVYIECDYQFYLDNGSNTTQATNMATGIFNLTQALYLNDSISTGLSQVDVWTTTDPYSTLATTSDILNSFGTAMAGGFNGDLAHFFSGRPLGGGIAWIDVLCFTPQYEVAVSASLTNSIIPVPTYSWNANVVTHEMGHNLGSKHTHACAWNGNNTRIDNCGGHAGYPSGTCADIIPDPPAGGTIMSYCHLVAVGVDLNLGFGPQPGTLIRSKVNGATCLTPCLVCNSNITVSNIISTPITESDTWIQTAGQTTILNSAQIKFDADPIDGFVLLQAGGTSDFVLANPNTTSFFVAQTLDGCGSASPARISGHSTVVEASRFDRNKFSLYPIPATDKITISNPTCINEIVGYDILSVDGKTSIHSMPFNWNGTKELDIKQISPGIYFLKIYCKDNIELIRFQKHVSY